MLDTFEGLAINRARIRNVLEQMEHHDTPTFDPVSFSRGFPALGGISIKDLGAALAAAVPALSAALADAFPPLAGKIGAVNKKLAGNDPGTQTCVDALLDNNLEKFKTSALTVSVSPETLLFILSEYLKVVLESKNNRTGADMDSAGWQEGYCPFCGAFPDIAFLRNRGSETETPSNFLKAQGGQLWVHCSRCGHQWRVKRSACVYCNSEEKKSYLTIEKEHRMRVYTCESCNKYIACVDEREDIEPDHPEALVVGAVPFYTVAREKGFSPVVDTPLHHLNT